MLPQQQPQAQQQHNALSSRPSLNSRTALPNLPGASPEHSVPPPAAEKVDIEPAVHAFSEWLCSVKGRNGQLEGEVNVEVEKIRRGILSGATQLTDYKRQMGTVQHSQHSMIADCKEKSAQAHKETYDVLLGYAQLETETRESYSALMEKLNIQTLEMETLKQVYSRSHGKAQAEVNGLREEIREVSFYAEEFRKTSLASNAKMDARVDALQNRVTSVVDGARRLADAHAEAVIRSSSLHDQIREQLGNFTAELSKMKTAFAPVQAEVGDRAEAVAVEQMERLREMGLQLPGVGSDGDSHSHTDTAQQTGTGKEVGDGIGQKGTERDGITAGSGTDERGRSADSGQEKETAPFAAVSAAAAASSGMQGLNVSGISHGGPGMVERDRDNKEGPGNEPMAQSGFTLGRGATQEDVRG
uniref:Uncharacterized protein n=1 Tax=Chromera velia CCMP2878 TaxID=1169474 RepID=A0A0G4FQM3_9ALVE|eukprot:Cvel_18245.t1-p1 / transcript=Cvel_18245.t1 / gene=Cvel_18245 / organism=Chromera_velia_CCMP2878 / gene_product=hypothetical protein / transcript_product=hypothetical protein / location=Cvel_scaffold1501:5312-9721(+) / protein_length=414 / sequence_SO=supercontig / SO=protein_coding / is_pseudo=false